MKGFSSMHVCDDPEYGVVLRFFDVEAADQFEDFLNESCYVMFQTKFEETVVSFFFGEASSVDKVEILYERFISSMLRK
ncbi:hypothetical protein [Marinobacter alkaliphilus]|uniref:Uncharacterized protein n=1 Tax=Marinobacter alkaliphilus TaxID=254719 RepID=A0ABZ3E0C1_9GAMM